MLFWLMKVVTSLWIVLNVPDIWDVWCHLVDRYFVYVISTHGVDAVSISIYNVLIVEEKFVCLHQLLLTLCKFVRWYLVLENVRELEVVVWDGLTAKHDHSVCIDHMKSDQPYFLLCHYVYNLPIASLCIQLLDGCPIGKSFIPYRVNVPLSESATVWSSHGLTKLGKCLLPFCGDVKGLTLTEIIPLEWATYYENFIFFLSYTEIYAVVHHISECLKLSLRDIELNNLWAGYIWAPIEALWLIPSNNQYILLVYHNYLTLADLPVIDLEGRPSQSLKIVEGMLIQLREVE